MIPAVYGWPSPQPHQIVPLPVQQNEGQHQCVEAALEYIKFTHHRRLPSQTVTGDISPPEGLTPHEASTLDAALDMLERFFHGSMRRTGQ